MGRSVRAKPKHTGVDARGKAERVNAHTLQLEWTEIY